MSGLRTIAIAVIFLVGAGCGPSERPKFNIKRASDYEPIRLPDPPANATITETATGSAAPEGAEMTIVEIGTFKGSCEHSFSGINDEDSVAIANPKGLRSYRLAGIAIPAEVRKDAHDQLRSWLAGEAVGIETEPGSSGADSPVYIYRCSTSTMVNAELVRSGLAVVADTPSAHQDALNKASMEALSARRGVWGSKSN